MTEEVEDLTGEDPDTQGGRTLEQQLEEVDTELGEVRPHATRIFVSLFPSTTLFLACGSQAGR